uniref:Putative secreted protein n=1 Tax=Anopheles darlingi TaxID=43151 RepID=A0A2M4D9Q0_ANODA
MARWLLLLLLVLLLPLQESFRSGIRRSFGISGKVSSRRMSRGRENQRSRWRESEGKHSFPALPTTRHISPTEEGV